MPTAPLLANAFSVPHAYGVLPLRDGGTVANPPGIRGLVRWARQNGLAGVDIPWALSLAKSTDFAWLIEQRIPVVLEARVLLEMTDTELEDVLACAVLARAPVVRFLLSSNLCGDRRLDPLTWNERLCRTVLRLKEWLPRFSDSGIRLVLENHQDSSTDDFLRILAAAKEHPALGFCFDTGNPLAVGEDPLKALRAILPRVWHVHLKDYRVWRSNNGFRLVRCAAGTGVVNFAEIYAQLQASPCEFRFPAVEVAAQQAREISIANPEWAMQRGRKSLVSLSQALSVFWARMEPDNTEWRTAWELGFDSETVQREEWRLMSESSQFLVDLWTKQGGRS